MTSPTQSRNKFLMVAAIASAAGVGGYLLGRQVSPSPPPPPPVPAVAPPVANQVDPVLERPALDRQAILAAIAAAADRHAAGDVSGGDSRALIGRPFEVHVAFGCDGPSPTNDLAGWRFDPEKKKLTVRVAPDDLQDTSQIKPLIERGVVESAKGFWISRPWTGEARCVAANPSVAAPIERSAGLVELRTPQGSRIGRRTKPLVAVKAMANGEFRAPAGFDLVLSGRVGRWPDGSAIRCTALYPSQRPACLIAVAIDEFTIDNIATGERIARWTG